MVDPLSITTSIIGCVTFGAKISISLYDLALTFKESSSEIKSVAKDITIFCSVLKQVESAFTNHDKAARFSEAAITTVSGIVERCQEFLQEIEKAVKSGNGESSVNIQGRVKWLFRRNKVNVLNGSFQAMAVTLHLMITTLEVAHNIHLQDNIDQDDTQAQASQKETELMAEGLVIAHESSLEELQVLEKDPEEQSSDATTAVNSQRPNKHKVRGWKSVAKVEREMAEKSPTSKFLADAVACHSSSRPSSVQSLSSIASEKSMLLRSKWTTQAPAKKEPLKPISKKVSNDRSSTPLDSSGTVRNPESQRKEPSSSQGVSTDEGVVISNEWDNLNSRWEKTISEWILKMEEQVIDKDNPMTSQLFTQIASLSAVGAELFKGYSELQASFGKAKAQFGIDLNNELKREMTIRHNFETQLNSEMAIRRDLEFRRESEMRYMKKKLAEHMDELDILQTRCERELKVMEEKLTETNRQHNHYVTESDQHMQNLEMRIREQKSTYREELKNVRMDRRALTMDLRRLETQLAAEKTQRMNVIQYLSGDAKEDSPVPRGNTPKLSSGPSTTLPLSPPSSPPPTQNGPENEGNHDAFRKPLLWLLDIPTPPRS